MPRNTVRPWLGIVVAAVLAGACGSSPSPSPPEAAPSEAAPSAVTAAGPGASGTAAAADEEAVAYAIAQRQVFGLRSDEAWVRQVAADPRARVQLLDFLMLPEEEAEFQARQTDFEAVAMAVNEYAAGRLDEFGGVWIDQPRHTVVAAWTRNAALHRLAILAKLGSAGPLEARLVRYTEQQLNALTDRLFADREWYATIGVAPRGGGADIMSNRVDFQVSSANPQAPALILAHFAVGPDMLRVTSDGTGIALQPRGTLDLTIVTSEGKAPGRNTLDVAWSPDHPDGRECGEGVGYGIPPDGMLSIACAPDGWTITIQAPAGEGWVPVGTGHAVVPPGGSAALEIRLRKGTELNP